MNRGVDICWSFPPVLRKVQSHSKVEEALQIAELQGPAEGPEQGHSSDEGLGTLEGIGHDRTRGLSVVPPMEGTPKRYRNSCKVLGPWRFRKEQRKQRVTRQLQLLSWPASKWNRFSVQKRNHYTTTFISQCYKATTF